MKSGTSMSTPLVSGAIALALEKDSLLSNVEIKMMLRDSCDDMGLPRNQQDGEVQLQKVFGIIGNAHDCIIKMHDFTIVKTESIDGTPFFG